MDANPYNSLKERLKEIMEIRKVSFPKLSVVTGIPASRMYKWYEQNTFPKAKDAAILENWISDPEFDISRFEEPKIPYLQARQNKKNSVTINTAPLIPVKAQAGYVKAMDQSVFIDTLEHYALPPGV